MLFLHHYNFKVLYKRGSSVHVTDKLSQAPCQDEFSKSTDLETFVSWHAGTPLRQFLQTQPATREQLRQATTACPDMQLLEHHIIYGCPPTKGHSPDQLLPF